MDGIQKAKMAVKRAGGRTSRVLIKSYVNYYIFLAVYDASIAD